MGARPMARLIRDRINRALADELLFGKLAQGGTVRVYEKEGELAFEIDSVGES
jgi:ATP-dependent Clp protease ATP-binding subunit ClpA